MNWWVRVRRSRIAIVSVAAMALGALSITPAAAEGDTYVDLCGVGAVGGPETLTSDVGPQHLVKVETRVNGGGQLVFTTDSPARCTILRDQLLATRPKPATTTFFVPISTAEWADTCESQLGQMFEPSAVVISTADPWEDQVDQVEAEIAISGGELVIHFQKSVNVQGFGVFELDADSPDCDVVGAHWSGAMVLYDPETPINPDIPTVSELLESV